LSQGENYDLGLGLVTLASASILTFWSLPQLQGHNFDLDLEGLALFNVRTGQSLGRPHN